jgi:putative lipoic acid-binding regulatory protein
MSSEEDTLFDFPCRFPVKAMGRETEGFPAHVMELVAAEVGEIAHDDVVVRPSSGGRFLSVTVTFTAQSRAQLDSVYRSLTGSDRILFVL